tara:strand:+ start:1273 stop:1506 length:234 start_codon:yes stop_codon:yes gene_type:complete
MQVGYVLYDPNTLKVLCLTKGKRGVELLEIKDTEKLTRALCLKDLTSMKDLYTRFQKNDNALNLDIVNIAKLYKHCS